MEITTIGRGKGKFVPNKVQINLLFQNRSKEYEIALSDGNQSINDFINQVIIRLGFTSDDLKTKTFVVKEEKIYNSQTESYNILGYLFESEALLEVPYNKDLIALFLNLVSQTTNPPQFTLNFGLVDEEKYHQELIEKAFQDALSQARIIANSANKVVKDTLKVSFEPFNVSFISSSTFSNKNISYSSENGINNFVNYLNPVDIEVEEVLYCLFLSS